MNMINRYKQWVLLLSLLAGFIACKEDPAKNRNQVTLTSTATPNQAQNNMALGLDKSPMDMSYYPVDYPKLKMSKTITEPLVARVIYSRPQKDGRIIFGNVLKYGEIWRLGANEATELEFFKDVNINKQKVAKGRYILYCVPFENNWKIVLNNDLYTWGLKIDSTQDAYHFDIPIAKTNYPFEVLSMEFEKAGKGMQLVMEWDSVKAILPINY